MSGGNLWCHNDQLLSQMMAVGNHSWWIFGARRGDLRQLTQGHSLGGSLSGFSVVPMLHGTPRCRGKQGQAHGIVAQGSFVSQLRDPSPGPLDSPRSCSCHRTQNPEIVKIQQKPPSSLSGRTTTQFGCTVYLHTAGSFSCTRRHGPPRAPAGLLPGGGLGPGRARLHGPWRM